MKHLVSLDSNSHMDTVGIVLQGLQSSYMVLSLDVLSPATLSKENSKSQAWRKRLTYPSLSIDIYIYTCRLILRTSFFSKWKFLYLEHRA